MNKTNWKSPIYLVGGLIGLVLGAITAHLYTRAAEENHDGEKPGSIGTGDLFKLTLSALGLIRLVTDLGAKSPDKK